MKFDILIDFIQPGDHPNCIAKRYIGVDLDDLADITSWEELKIQIEYRYSDFIKHPSNKVEDIDMIGCWEHDWKECPESIEVFELKKEVAKLKDIRVESPDIISRSRKYEIISVE